MIDSQRYESLQGRAGVDLGGSLRNGSVTISPRLTATFVHDFMDQPASFLAAFAATGFGAAAVPFLLPNTDNTWGEIGGAVRIGGQRLSLDLSADTTVGRGDVNYRTYRGSLTIRF